MTARNDWSTRHVKLRRRLFLLALLIFVFSRVRIPALDMMFIDTVSGTVITTAELVFLLSLGFLYVFVEFSVRTSAETRDISNYSAKLQRSLHRIEEIRNKTALLFRSFEGALLSKRLHVWDEALKTTSAPLSASDRKLFETIGTKLERLEASLGASRTAIDTRDMKDEEGEPATGGNQKLHVNNEASEILGQLEKMNQIGHIFEERRRGLDRAISESRDVMTDVRSFFSDSAGRGAEDLNVKLAAAVSNIKSIQQELRTGSQAHHVDRYIFSVRLPKTISWLLIILSADVIVRGAMRFAERGSDIATMMLPTQ